jgi:hypothetical protein
MGIFQTRSKNPTLRKLTPNSTRKNRSLFGGTRKTSKGPLGPLGGNTSTRPLGGTSRSKKRSVFGGGTKNSTGLFGGRSSRSKNTTVADILPGNHSHDRRPSFVDKVVGALKGRPVRETATRKERAKAVAAPGESGTQRRNIFGTRRRVV